MTPQTQAASARTTWPRNAAIAGGALGLAGLGLAAGLWLGTPRDAARSAAADVAEAAPIRSTTAPAATSTAKPPPVAATTRPPAGPGRDAGAALPTQPVANACAHCGVVEAVRAVQLKGEGTGVGAVAGGVLGGVLGNQIGKGGGRAVATVIGAVGGGVAGHEVEKRARSQTAYEVRVRMDDGSLRTLTQSVAPAPGSRVRVDGQQLRGISAQEAPRAVRVAAPAAT